MQLYIERVDPANPANYLERRRSVPFEVMDDMARVRDRAGSAGLREVPLSIRLSERGPVISDHGMSVADGKLIGLRWRIAEDMRSNDRGGMLMFLARSVADVDVDGNIGHFTGVRVPIRRGGDGSLRHPISAPARIALRLPGAIGECGNCGTRAICKTRSPRGCQGWPPTNGSATVRLRRISGTV